MSESLNTKEPMTSCAELPQEIWLHIFRLATSTPTSHEECELEYSPFRAISFLDRDWSSMQVTLNVKRNLVLVCRAWRALAMEVMFETVRIRHGSEGLQKGLGRSGEELGVNGYGRWVRHIEISPQIIDFDPFNPIGIPGILERCTRAEILVRPYISAMGNPPLGAARFSSGYHFPSLQSLKRIDWWMPHDGPPLAVPERLGFFGGFFGDLLRNSPNLTYLSLGDDESFSTHPNHSTAQVFFSLPSLTTLRLESQDPRLYHRIRQWSLPKLTQLILSPAHLCLSVEVLKVFGSQLRVVELLRCDTSCNQHYFGEILVQCPNLQEFNYHADKTVPPPTLPAPHQNLQIVRLHLCAKSRGVQTGHLLSHFFLLAGSSLPALEHIVFSGDWNLTVGHDGFRFLRDSLRNRNCVLELGSNYVIPTDNP